MDTTKALPADEFSRTLSQLLNHPAHISSSSTIDAVTMLGHSETWVIRTVRVEGEETLFLQQINAEGGRRFVLPPAVAAALNRHVRNNCTETRVSWSPVRERDQVLGVSRKRAANKAAATRKAKGSK